MIIFFAYKVDVNMAYLDIDESRHCMKVLRKKTGGIVQFTDGKGVLYSGEILNAKREVVLHNLNIIQKAKKKKRIIVAVSPTKNLSRFEWFVEKVVEIGVTDIIPLICDRTEKKMIKIDRTLRIVRSAAKQSLNLHHTILHDSMTVESIIDYYNNEKLNKYIASYDVLNDHLFSIKRDLEDTIILIGPEGDFTEDELRISFDNDFTKVNISSSRLRTETAGVVAGEILCLRNELGC